MKNLINSKIFIATFLITHFVFSFFTITLESGFGTVSEYGFPYTYYYSTCFGGGYSWMGLVGNIIFATIFSFIVGIIFKIIWLQIESKKLL